MKTRVDPSTHITSIVRGELQHAKEVLLQSETRVSEGLSYRKAGALGKFIDKLLEANDSIYLLDDEKP